MVSVSPSQSAGVHKHKAATPIIMPQRLLIERIVKEVAIDEKFMEIALQEAKTAGLEGEVPVGAVLIKKGEIIGRDHNRCIQLNDPTAHAEILVIRKGGEAIANYRLPETTLYATIEPCPMCVGAITQARIEKLVYGASDEKTGAVSSKFRLLNDPDLNHRVEVKRGVLKQECSEILRNFFKERR